MSVSSSFSNAASSSDWKTVVWSSAPNAWRVFDMLSRRRLKNPPRWASPSSREASRGGVSSPVSNSSCQVRATRTRRIGTPGTRRIAVAGGAFPGALRGLVGGRERVILRRAAGELARDHARDPVAAHAHAVQRVGGVHGSFLVRDDDELGAV